MKEVEREKYVSRDNRVLELREYYGLTQQELANKVGISKSMLSYIETGKRAPNVFIALDIADALDTTVEKLFRKNKLQE